MLFRSTSNMKDERIMQSIRKNKIQFESVSRETMDRMVKGNHQGIMAIVDDFNYADYKSMYNRSEERRVGKECRSRWSPYH